jgi:hypothetical protein
MYQIRPYYPHDGCLHMSPSHVLLGYVGMGLRYGPHPFPIYFIGIIMCTFTTRLMYIVWQLNHYIYTYNLILRGVGGKKKHIIYMPI